MTRSERIAIVLLTAAIATGALARLNVLRWHDPWGPHHPDEHILQLEALGLWEGITPREVGWPGSTTRIVLSVLDAAVFAADSGHSLAKAPGRPDVALQEITGWIGRQYLDPSRLYEVGRALSALTGIAQLALLAWALSRWVGGAAASVGVLACALSPLTVVYSQYVLADITGLACATVVLGLAAQPTRRRIVAMAILASLAAASKFHFGLWLLTPAICIWDCEDLPRSNRVKFTLVTIAAFLVIMLAAVPWFWLNPVLMLKEFLGVVGSKVSAQTTHVPWVARFAGLFVPLGALAWAGGAAGALSIRRGDLRRVAPVLLPTLLGVLALMASAVVFDRYSLAFFPGVCLLVGLAARRWAIDGSVRGRAAFVVLGIVASLWTAWDLVNSQRAAGAPSVEAEAQRWVLEHVPRGAKVGVQDESNAFLPRSAEQLVACVQEVETSAAYTEKWQTEGYAGPSPIAVSMQSVILNDERFSAYWCQRELQAMTQAGYSVIAYHPGPRFNVRLEREVLDEFRRGSTGGVDVLITNRLVDVGRPPVHVIESERGIRAIYRR